VFIKRSGAEILIYTTKSYRAFVRFYVWCSDHDHISEYFKPLRFFYDSSTDIMW